MQLRFGIAVAMASSYSSNSVPSLGTFTSHGCSPKKTEEKKEEEILDQIRYLLLFKGILHLYFSTSPSPSSCTVLIYLWILNSIIGNILMCAAQIPFRPFCYYEKRVASEGDSKRKQLSFGFHTCQAHTTVPKAEDCPGYVGE